MGQPTHAFDLDKVEGGIVVRRARKGERLIRLDWHPLARLVEPPWGDREWIERGEAREEGLFARWPLLAPQLLEWKAEVLG